MPPFFLASLFNIYTEDITTDVGEKGGSVDFNELNFHGHKIKRTILSCYPMVDKHGGEKCLNLNAKKGQAYEDRQNKGRSPNRNKSQW